MRCRRQLGGIRRRLLQRADRRVVRLPVDTPCIASGDIRQSAFEEDRGHGARPISPGAERAKLKGISSEPINRLLRASERSRIRPSVSLTS